MEKWKAKKESSRAYSPPPKTRIIDLPERRVETVTEEKTVPERPLPKEKVTMTIRNTDISVILRALARSAGQNIMMNDGVKGITNVNVKDTPWDQVFRGLLATQGLTYTWQGDIIRVLTLKDMEHARSMEEIKKKKKLRELEMKRTEPLLTRIIYIRYADAKSLAENLEKLLIKQDNGKKGESPRGSVNVDEHNNALIINAIRDDMAKMITLIEKLDRPTPQVVIEANIVETTRETARELGIQWGGLYLGTKGPNSNNYYITPGTSTGGVMGQTLTPGIDPTSGMAADFPIDLSRDLRGTDAALNLGFVAEKVGSFVLNTQLSALESERKLNILSSPSITTLDNQPAIIESGAEVPFQTIEGTGSNQTINIDWKRAVLKLEVTPHVVDKNLLKLKIVTHKDELDFTRTVQGNPTIITKKAETNVILFDGQTTVIGGLSKGTERGSESGAPWLKDVPILGYLFKAEGKGNEMEEVLIFITPHILKQKLSGHEQEPAG